jgi:hypothetical protein
MWQVTASSCCSPNGHCKRQAPHTKGTLAAFHTTRPENTSSPAKQPRAERDCKQLAFERHSAIDHQLTLVALNEDSGVILVSLARPPSTDLEFRPLGPSPPDRQALFSTFLI